MVILNGDSNKPIIIQHRTDFGPAGMDIRQHYYDDSTELQPTKKGVRIPVENQLEFLAVVMMHVMDWKLEDLETIVHALLIADWDHMSAEWNCVVDAAKLLELEEVADSVLGK